jgi:hypothetical protein
MRSDRERCPVCRYRGGSEPAPLLLFPVPWNRIVVARTHDDASVFICPECETPLERRWRRLRNTQAAAAAVRNRGSNQVLAIECEWQPGYFTDDGREILGEHEGEIWVADPDDVDEYFDTLRALTMSRLPEVAEWTPEQLDAFVAEALVRVRESNNPDALKQIEQDRLSNGPEADRRIIQEKGLRHYLVVSIVKAQQQRRRDVADEKA